ncbi:SagB/ThcOx family dehydrogenase [bacterium]|nr:SagB/ThcOx family dehydrogenase [bacterium]
MSKPSDKTDFSSVLHYHERTKHHPRRYAASLGFMDWDTQPHPFRIYEGSEKIELLLRQDHGDLSYQSMLNREGIKTAPFDLPSISKLLELSLALSAWKSVPGSKWALRINPSSGNLHPTESHFLFPPGVLDSKDALLTHYNPHGHVMDVRSRIIPEGLPPGFCKPEQGFFLALTSIYWRESWKYGERAFRYCNHDLGHALACLSFSAALLGWRAHMVLSPSTSQITELFRLSEVAWIEEEKEELETLIHIIPDQSDCPITSIDTELVRALKDAHLEGSVNKLSSDHHPWAAIENVSQATEKPQRPINLQERSSLPFSFSFPAVSAAKTISKRRSAVDFDGKTSISKDQFFSMLESTLPRKDKPPFDLNADRVRVHLLIFVHRVEGLKMGMYFLARNPEDLEEIKLLSHQELLWEKVPDSPASLPLYKLLEADLRMEATLISCQQDIAGMSAFSLGMIARFREELRDQPWVYRRLYWETGIIGQVLYLEAESHGIQATGIGCFFDDLAHRALGLGDDQYQSLYHFTVGGAVQDSRISSLAPYHHLDESRTKTQGVRE